MRIQFNRFLYVITATYCFGLWSASDNTRISSKVLGAFEIRPSYKSMMGEFHSEDSAILGYQFSPNLSATYKQEFNTNVYDPQLTETQSGLNAYLVDGYFKERAGNRLHRPT